MESRRTLRQESQLNNLIEERSGMTISRAGRLSYYPIMRWSKGTTIDISARQIMTPVNKEYLAE